MRGAGRLTIVLGVLCAFVLAGCRSPQAELKKADREAYGLLSLKEMEVLGRKRPFTIDTRYSDRDPQKITAKEIIEDRQKTGMVTVDLNQAIKMALENNRDYQTRKETLYLSALSLSDTRHKYGVQPDHATDIDRDRDSTDQHNYSSSATTQLSLSKLFKSGGTLAVTLVNDLFKFTTGPDPMRSATSTLTVRLTQPLLRGAGRKIAAENLKQSERNVIYEVRSFTRYQRSFLVDIATQYYGLAQLKDTIYNEYNNYQSLVRSRKRSEALAKDRLPEFQVDQTRQDELRSRNRYITAVQDYFDDLDEFKELLGLPLDYKLTIDASSLEQLTKRGLKPVNVKADAAFETALKKRLDLLNDIDQFDDSKRKLVIAADELKAEVKFSAFASLPSSEETKWAKFNIKNWYGGMGVQIKLPIDRLNERNDLRREVIDFERQLRALAIAVDGVKTDIRTAVRRVEQTRKSYQIQKLSVELAERRVESANMLLQAGRAETRDLLDAQNALLSAKNALTSDLVAYHLTRLRLLRDMGLLDLQEGKIVELLDSKGTEDGDQDKDDLLSPDELFGSKETKK